jgi:hypothetical protein
MEGTMDRIAVAMSSAFAAFPAPLAGAPPPRRKVEYGTGLIVSSAGDIVTDADLLTGCEFIVAPPFGYAERIAEDGGLALLRVNGARDLAPVALGGTGGAGGSAGAAGGEVTLVGIADPQSQNGGSAVSAVRGRIAAAGGSSAIEPAPAAGFAGSAMIDRDGNLAGIVGLHPASAAGSGAQAGSTTGVQAALVPTAAIAKFLNAQNIPAGAGRAGIEGAKAAALRLICVRK